jgi:hypothetical protein
MSLGTEHHKAEFSHLEARFVLGGGGGGRQRARLRNQYKSVTVPPLLPAWTFCA